MKKDAKETDLIARSNKKVKIREGAQGGCDHPIHQADEGDKPRRKLSYRKKLVGRETTNEYIVD